MDNEEYLAVQQQVIMLSNLVLTMPLDEFIKKADLADTIGPIFDPTLWIKGHDNLSKIAQLAKGLQHFQNVVKETLTHA